MKRINLKSIDSLHPIIFQVLNHLPRDTRDPGIEITKEQYVVIELELRTMFGTEELRHAVVSLGKLAKALSAVGLPIVAGSVYDLLEDPSVARALEHLDERPATASTLYERRFASFTGTVVCGVQVNLPRGGGVRSRQTSN